MEQVFFENRALYFASSEDPDWPGIRKFRYENIRDWGDFVRNQFVVLPDYRAVRIDCGEKAAGCFQRFIDRFTVIEAGGGLTEAVDPKTGQKEYLYIFRNRMWDLPKGKKEAGETDAENALREVEEETGVRNLEIRRFLGSTWHFILYKNGSPVLKKTNWFEMGVPEIQNLSPQTEEGIMEARWLSWPEIKEKLPCMYASVANLTNRFFSDPARTSR